MKKKIYLIDIKGANTANINNSLKNNFDIQSIKNPLEIEDKKPNIVLPGNGSFGYYVSFLKENNWKLKLKEIINGEECGKLICICSGFQALGFKSEESIGFEGLGLIDYNFHSLNNYFKSPLIINIGRKSIYESDEGLKLKDLKFTKYTNIKDLMNPYFVHGFAAKLKTNCTKGIKKYCYLFNKVNEHKLLSGIISNNLCATQFHPELSGILWKEFMIRFFS